jgi:pimeloyl-ACP methyl ester carboxylesterase
VTGEPSPRHLDANGGRVYYEVRGSGPVLFVIGQPMTSGPFGPLADLLADDHTVVTYDPHGVGKSTVADPTLDVTPEIEAADLAAIVDDLGAERADIFGSSGGAVAGLAFAAHHSEKLGTLIAHEPPVTELLADASHIRAVVEDVQDTYRAAGAGPAWGKFVSMVVYDGPLTEPRVPAVSWPPGGSGETQDGAQSADTPPSADAGETQDQPSSDASTPATSKSEEQHSGAGETEEQHSGGGPGERSEKDQADDELFFLRMLKPFTGYDVPVETLRTGRPRIVVAVGAASGGQIAARSAQALAEGLGTPAEVFPGDHGGFMADPAGFATAIREVLSKS